MKNQVLIQLFNPINIIIVLNFMKKFDFINAIITSLLITKIFYIISYKTLIKTKIY